MRGPIKILWTGFLGTDGAEGTGLFYA